MMITLQNTRLTLSLAEMGAEMKSLLLDGKEQLWDARPEVWGSTAPLLFPICGGLKNDTYTYGGKTYTLPKHGYARRTLFSVESADVTRAVFLHLSNTETHTCFPFDYELRVIYELKESSVAVTYEVKNRTDGEMLFSIGSHEAYYTPEGIEDYDVVFPQSETLDSYVLYGNLLSSQRLPILKDSSVLPLYEKYFTVDALVFKDLKSRTATLRNRKTGRAIAVDFPDAPYFLLWHKPNAPYICLEPWAGIQDPDSSDGQLSNKEGILRLDRGEVYRSTHVIRFLS